MSVYTLSHLKGWYEVNTEGLGIVYVSIVDEAFITQPTDTPANIKFRPRILNPETFHISRRPMVWVWDNSSSQLAVAAFGELQIDNYDGAFDFLIKSDIRDAVLIFKLPPALMLGGATTYNDAPIIATAILDDVTVDSEDVIRLTLKDTLSRIDRPANVRFFGPYVESSAASQMVPWLFGACRNVPFRLVQSEIRLYQGHDTTLANIASVRDKGAVLDTLSSPPQVVPSINRAGFQLSQDAVGLLLADASSVGTQAIQPGVTDVLAGVGTLDVTDGLTTWASGAAPPTGFTYSSLAFGTFTRYAATTGLNSDNDDYSMGIATQKNYNPLLSSFGCYAFVTTPFLNPGEHYRVRFILDRVFGSNAPTNTGFQVRTDLTVDPRGSVSGAAFGPYLDAPSFGGQNYSFDYACPEDGTTRTLYMIACGGTTSFTAVNCIWHGLTVEKLGQFAELQLQGITFANFWFEVLFNREYEPLSVWSSADLIALDTTFAYTFGVFADTPPNLKEFICAPLNNCCAAPFTDALGAIRARALIDPTDPNGPAARCAFDLTNTERPISIVPDRAQYLTTVAGIRKNWKQAASDDDFVTDRVAVPQEVMERFKREFQYQVTATVKPAGQYSFAVNALPLKTSMDDPVQGLIEINRVVSIYKPNVYSDGTVHNGKRNFVIFWAHFDDIISLGNGVTCAAYDLLFGDIVLLTYPAHGFNNTRLMVAGTDLYPFAQKIQIVGFY